MDINSHWRTKLRRELPLRFFVVLVAGIPVRDLLLRAKHLFVAAILRDSRYLLRINNSTRDVPGAVYCARVGLFGMPSARFSVFSPAVCSKEKPPPFDGGLRLHKGNAPAYALRALSPREPAMPPIRLTDSELDAVLAAARPLAVEMRDPFLRAVATRAAGLRGYWPRHRRPHLRGVAAAVLRPAGSLGWVTASSRLARMIDRHQSKPLKTLNPICNDNCPVEWSLAGIRSPSNQPLENTQPDATIVWRETNSTSQDFGPLAAPAPAEKLVPKLVPNGEKQAGMTRYRNWSQTA